MMTGKKLYEYEPDHLVYPSQIVAHEMEIRDIGERQLAKLMRVSLGYVANILRFEAPITSEVACRLERAMKMPVEYWLKVQQLHDESVMRLAKQNDGR